MEPQRRLRLHLFKNSIRVPFTAYGRGKASAPASLLNNSTTSLVSGNSRIAFLEFHRRQWRGLLAGQFSKFRVEFRVGKSLSHRFPQQLDLMKIHQLLLDPFRRFSH